MTNPQHAARFAAAVYTPETPDRMALLRFAEKLKAQNIKVGGVLQEALLDSEGEIIGLDAIDVATDERLPVSRATANKGECGMDVAALADTTGIIRNAIAQGVDLVVVEKFGELEKQGKGLIDEIMQTIVEEIPLLISVSASSLDAWQECSGELGDVLCFDDASFQRWWQALDTVAGPY
ncbi:MAG: DUF2478 domain-containing protein [Gammaproteobacteria bacterium]|nr:DUF2478 domain-containing protein [Gammaproteobacteria bacterium]